jgi:cell division protein FtsL
MNNNTLQLTDLPIEVRYNIFSYLDAANLSSLARVNQEWKAITGSPILWRNLFEREKRNWKSFTSESVTSNSSSSISSMATTTIRSVFAFINKLTEETQIDEDDKSNINWKELYLQQFFENNSNRKPPIHSNH